MTKETAAERIHSLFSEFNRSSKVCAKRALLFDVVVLIASVVSLVASNFPVPVYAVTVIACSAAGYHFRHRASGYWFFSRRCRRISVYAYALGVDVDPLTASSVEREAFRLGGPSMVTTLRRSSLSEYYDSSESEGYARLRDVYAHSSYYSNILLRRLTRLLVALSFTLLAALFLILYWLASSPLDMMARATVAQVASFVVGGFFLFRCADAAFSASSCASRVQRTADEFLEEQSESSLSRLVIDYEIDRVIGPSVPDWLYARHRSYLSEQWARRREALGGVYKVEPMRTD